MQIYAFISLINCVIALSLGIFLITINLHHSAHRRLALVNFAIAMWAFGYFQWQEAVDYTAALWWVRFLTIGSILLPALFVLWVLTFLGETKKYRLIIILTFLISIIFLAISYSPYMVQTVGRFNEFPFWPKPGIAYHFFLAFQFIGLMSFGFYRLIVGYLTKSGIIRKRLGIIIPGMVVGFLCGLTNFPYWYGINIPPIGNFLIIIYPLSLSWAILQYRFVDVRYTFEETFVRLIKIILLWVFFVILGLLYSKVLNESIALVGYMLFALFASITIVIINDYVDERLHRVIKTLIFGNSSTINDQYSKFKKDLASITSLKQLLTRTNAFISSAMDISNSYLILNPNQEIDENSEINIQYTEIEKYLIEDTQIYITDELKTAIDEEMIPVNNLEKISAIVHLLEINNLSALIILPRVESKGDLLFLGNKSHANNFTIQETQTLDSMKYHLAIVLDNILLYEKEKAFNARLQGEIDKATVELKQTYEQLKTIDKMKDYIIDISSHELRTPATIIKSYLWLIMQGKKGPLTDAQKIALSKAFDSNERLIQLINDMLDVSRIEGGRLELRLSEFDLVTEIREIIDQLLIKANEKNIYLKFDKPEQTGIILFSDKEKVSEIIVNLLTNSIKYTKEGGVVISVQCNNDSCIIKVTDTGIGIPAEDMPKLFTKFYRTEQTLVQVPSAGGTGLGLFITKSLVNLLGGMISVESKENQGSTFIVNLPKRISISK